MEEKPLSCKCEISLMGELGSDHLSTLILYKEGKAQIGIPITNELAEGISDKFNVKIDIIPF